MLSMNIQNAHGLCRVFSINVSISVSEYIHQEVKLSIGQSVQDIMSIISLTLYESVSENIIDGTSDPRCSREPVTDWLSQV